MTEAARSPSRSAQRYRLARLAVAFGGLDRGVTVLVSLLRVPLLVWGLELYQYGLYMAILGVVATANLLDFGLHFGVLNAVAAARGRDDEAAIRKTMATALLIYGAIVAAAACLLLPVVWVAPLSWILSIPAEQVPLAREVALLGFCSVLLPMPFKVFAAGLAGFQKQYAVSAYTTVSNVVQLALLAAAVVIFREQLLVVAAVTLVGQLLHWGFFSWYAVRQQPDLAIRLRAASRSLAPALVGAGLTFFVTNLANLFKFTLGNTVVSHGLGPAAVPTFSVPLALFFAALQSAGVVSVSLWPAYGEAAARGEWHWVQRAFALGARTTVGVGAAFAILGCLYGDLVIDVWMPKRITPSHALLALLAIWLVLQSCVNTVATLLSGLHRIRIVMWISLAEGVSALALSLWFVERAGVEGVAAAMALSSAVSAALLLGWAMPLGTDRKVHLPARDLARIALCVVVTFGAGLTLRQVLAAATPLVTLFVGAGLTAAVCAAAAWLLVLAPGERERLRSWVRERLSRRRR